MNVSDSKFIVPTERNLSATGWFVVVYFGALFLGMLALTWCFS